jgi:hypothetical protein
MGDSGYVRRLDMLGQTLTFIRQPCRAMQRQFCHQSGVIMGNLHGECSTSMVAVDKTLGDAKVVYSTLYTSTTPGTSTSECRV